MIVSSRSKVLSYAVVTAFAFLSVYPILGLVSIALKPANTLYSTVSPIPTSFHFGNFARAWNEGSFGPAFVTSGTITVTVVILATVLSTAAGYAFGTMRFRGSRLLFGILLLGLVIPMPALIVPLYYDLRSLGLSDSKWSVILPQTSLSIAFGTYWMRTFFASTPKELSEAAMVDGASRGRVLRSVLLPTARPAIQTLALLLFLNSFNDFLLPLVMLENPNVQTVPLSVAVFTGPHLTDDTGIAAAALLACLPVMVVYLALQRSLIDGLTAGAVKG